MDSTIFLFKSINAKHSCGIIVELYKTVLSFLCHSQELLYTSFANCLAYKGSGNALARFIVFLHG